MRDRRRKKQWLLEIAHHLITKGKINRKFYTGKERRNKDDEKEMLIIIKDYAAFMRGEISILDVGRELKVVK